MAYKKFCAKSLGDSLGRALFVGFLGCWSANTTHAQTQQDGMQLHIDDPRPVAKAVEELVARYGYVITYEDPRFSYEADLQDVTAQVRRDLDRYPPGKAPKVIGPRGGMLSVTLPTSVSTPAIALALDQLINAQSSRGEGGRFRVIQVGDVFHVVPTEVADRNGNWISQSSILDFPISLPIEDRSELGMIDAIATAASAAAHVKIVIGSGVGGGIGNPNRPRPYRLGADNERARDVLMRALALLNDRKFGTWISERLRWQLFYDSDSKVYFLNISTVPDRALPAVSDPALKSSSGTSVDATSSGISTGTRKTSGTEGITIPH